MGKVLKGKEAYDLLLSGKINWNFWVGANSDWRIEITDCCFEFNVDFDGFIFPHNGISFREVEFNEKVNFERNVDDGVLEFFGCDFNSLYVLDCKFKKIFFEKCKFKNEFRFCDNSINRIDIHHSSMELNYFSLVSNDIDKLFFYYSEFKIKSYFTFSLNKVDECSFSKVVFKCKTLDFRNNTYVNDSAFYYVKFLCNDVYFNNTSVDICDFEFYKTVFSGLIVDFSDLKVKSKNLIINNCNIYSSRMNFESMYCHGRAEFIGSSSFLTDFSFKGARIGRGLVFDVSINKEVEFDASAIDVVGSISFSQKNKYKILDFRDSTIGGGVDLNNVDFSFCRDRRKCKGISYLKSRDVLDISRMRKLKELADERHDHDKALQFFSYEMKAKRWREMRFWPSILDMVYSRISNYGRRIFAPLLVVLILLSSNGLYLAVDSNQYRCGESERFCYITHEDYFKSLVVSGYASFPFIGSIKSGSSNNLKAMYTKVIDGKTVSEIPSSAYFALSIQTIFSSIFLFLTGLGIRNRFRI